MITIQRIFTLLFTLTVVTTQAEEFNHTISYRSGWLTISQRDGLTINLPAKETHEILSQVRNLSAELNAVKSQCTEDVANTRFTSKDIMITAIMPGGLLFAAFKKQKHTQAIHELKTVTAELNGLDDDLDFLMFVNNQKVLASR